MTEASSARRSLMAPVTLKSGEPLMQERHRPSSAFSSRYDGPPAAAAAEGKHVTLSPMVEVPDDRGVMKAEVNNHSPFESSKFTKGRKIHRIMAQRCWDNTSALGWQPNELQEPREMSCESYMGQPMVQTEPATCVLVACTKCVEAVHRFKHEKLHGKGTTTTFPFRAEPPCDLLKACRIDGIWKPGVGANVGDVLTKIQQMGGVPAKAIGTNKAPAPAQCFFLPLCSWHQHMWHDNGGLSPESVANLLYNNGPCIGLLWVSREYHSCDADRDDAPVYTSGYGRSDDARRSEMEEHYPGEVGWHAVVCVGFRHAGREVLVVDNHTPTGPRRWIDFKEFHTLYTLTV